MQLDAWHDLERLTSAMTLSQGPTDPPAIADRGAGSRIERAAAGCNHARAALLREHEDAWYRFSLSLLGDPETARDATQETALRVLKKLPGFRGEAAFKTWTLSIALNVCREQRRRRRWLALPAGLSKADTLPGPPARAESTEDSRHLAGLLEQLPRRQREAVTLRYLQQLSTAETAAAMGCAEGTVKATLAKALTTLRKQWELSDAG